MRPMSFVIETTELCRTYKIYQKPEGLKNSIRGIWNRKYKEKVALKNINLKIEPGQIIGLVGANGAGKTTLLKILSGLIIPSQGSARVLGHNPWEREYEFLRRISILLGQKNQLWWDISPMDSYALLAKIYNLDPSRTRQRVQDLAKLLNCTHVLETQLRRLSLGERMKMEIIGSLLHEPEVLFLDEPTIGLDIVAQSTIREFLADYVKQRGPTVILTSHYMDDIAKLAKQLLLISRGEIVYDGSVSNFTGKTKNRQEISLVLESQLEEDLNVGPNLQLKAGQREYKFQIENKELAQIISQVSAKTTIQDIKILEVDFENVIHDFLQKESRVL